MSVMEISHRSETFDEIIQGAGAGLRELLGVPKDYQILFLQGGASLQFAMVPMNFLSLDSSADYIVTGNKRDLPEVSYGVTRVVNDGELLEPRWAAWLSTENTRKYNRDRRNRRGSEAP